MKRRPLNASVALLFALTVRKEQTLRRILSACAMSLGAALTLISVVHPSSAAGLQDMRPGGIKAEPGSDTHVDIAGVSIGPRQVTRNKPTLLAAVFVNRGKAFQPTGIQPKWFLDGQPYQPPPLPVADMPGANKSTTWETGQERQYAASFTLSPGYHTIKAVIERQDAERKVDNNTASVQVLAGISDLVAYSDHKYRARTYTEGGSRSEVFRAQNKGNIPSEACLVRLKFSRRSGYASGNDPWTLIGERVLEIPALAPGGEWRSVEARILYHDKLTQTGKLGATSANPPQRYQFDFAVDAQNKVVEDDNENNKILKEVLLQGGDDHDLKTNSTTESAASNTSTSAPITGAPQDMPGNAVDPDRTLASSPVRWVFEPSPKPGRLGRVVVRVSDEAAGAFITRVFNPGSEVGEVGGSYKGVMSELMPGQYDVELSGARVRDVPVKQGTDTRLLTGLLNVTVNTVWHLFDETQKTKLNGGYSGKKIGLPVGKYYIQVGGRFAEVIIRDGQVTDF